MTTLQFSWITEWKTTKINISVLYIMATCSVEVVTSVSEQSKPSAWRHNPADISPHFDRRKNLNLLQKQNYILFSLTRLVPYNTRKRKNPVLCRLYRWADSLLNRNARNSKINLLSLVWLARSLPSYLLGSIRWVGPQEMWGQQLCAGSVTDIYSPGRDPSLGQPVTCNVLTLNTVSLLTGIFDNTSPL